LFEVKNLDKKPAANKSPAPVVSTRFSIFSGFILITSEFLTIFAPFSPSVKANILLVF
jgi:hypothetical protein